MPRDTAFLVIHLLVLAMLLGAMLVTGADVHGPRCAKPWKTAQIQARNLAAAIDNYQLLNHRLPPVLATLTQTSAKDPHQYFDEICNDPWDHPFEYRVEGKKYTIRSRGEDGRLGTDDDIVWPHESPRWR